MNLPNSLPDAGRNAVRLKGVSKSYVLKASGSRLGNWFSRGGRETEATVFWALRDLDLEIKAGRALGILGLNGAGKSTLLGIIAGTLQPTEGRVEVDGRVQLLQLGAGFAGELSGRENVIAHARARGISGAEIERRVEYVQEFADIGPFFDQPMSSYSSGMYGRVAFGNAFAVHPEILIVDEALAVGDAVFVNKCYRKIQEIREEGTTILFTSHSSDAIVRLCDDGVVLHKGQLIASGTARHAVQEYSTIVLGDAPGQHASPIEALDNIAAASAFLPDDEQNGDSASKSVEATYSGRFEPVERCVLYNSDERVFGKGGARIVQSLVKIDGEELQGRLVKLGSVVEFRFRVHFEEAVAAPNFGFTLNDETGVIFYGVNQLWRGEKLLPVRKGDVVDYRMVFKAQIAGGDWFLTPAVADGLTVLQQREAALHFKVIDLDKTHIGKGWLDLNLSRVSPAN